MNTVSEPITKSDPHYDTPVAFAKWRINEFKKPVRGGIINETIDTAIEFVNSILGQYIENDTHSWGHKFEQFEDGDMALRPYNRKMSIFLRGLRLIPQGFSIFALAPGAPGNIRRIIMPIILYIGLCVGTIGLFGGEYIFNIYRLLALLLLYVISYTELTYWWFCLVFLIGIGFEIVFIVLQSVSEES